MPARWLGGFSLLTFINVLQSDAPTAVLWPWDWSSRLVSCPSVLRGIGLMMPPDEVSFSGSTLSDRGVRPCSPCWCGECILRKKTCDQIHIWWVPVSQYIQGSYKIYYAIVLCTVSCLLAIVASRFQNVIIVGTHRRKINNIWDYPYDLDSVFSVTESRVLPKPPLSTRAPLKGKGNRHTKCFSLTPRGDQEHFEATYRGLSLKHLAIHNCGFHKPAFFSQHVKWNAFLMDLTVLLWNPASPRSSTKWALCNTGEGNKCHKNVISPLN